jgi:hypothetical protein
MAHDDKKWTKGMTPAQKEKFETEDNKNDSKLANKIKGYMSTAKTVRSKEKDAAAKAKEKPAAKKAETKKKPKKK